VAKHAGRSEQKKQAPLARVPETNPTPAEQPGQPWVLYLLLIAAVGLVAAVAFRFVSADGTSQRQDTPDHALPAVGPGVPSVLVEFSRLKNAGDPRADDLLAPAPALPAAPVLEDEAERLDAQLFLRQPFKVTQIRREGAGAGGQPRFVLVAEGSVQTRESVTLHTEDGGIRPHFRALYNPDFLVELRDGKIFGVRVKVHEDPDKPSLTPEQFRQLLQPDPEKR
jgi:hypothetical protein